MKLNPNKGMYRMQKGRFLGLVITIVGIETNPETVETLLKTQKTKAKKDIQSVHEKLAAMGRFLAMFVEKTFPFFKELKTNAWKNSIEWSVEAKETLQILKHQLLSFQYWQVRPVVKH